MVKKVAIHKETVKLALEYIKVNKLGAILALSNFGP